MRNAIFRLFAIALLASAGSSAAAANLLLGDWKNPSNSVHIKIDSCGANMCGTVIWANEKAQADARKGGTDTLVGQELFREFKLQKPQVWRGKVFVPDLGKTFSGRITVVDEDTLRAKGCALGGVACKSQEWTRLTE